MGLGRLNNLYFLLIYASLLGFNKLFVFFVYARLAIINSCASTLFGCYPVFFIFANDGILG